jgi:hypothetical protein
MAAQIVVDGLEALHGVVPVKIASGEKVKFEEG